MPAAPTRASQAGNAEPPLHHLVGIALKVSAVLIFTGMAAGVKYLSGAVPVGEIIFFRSFFGLPVLLVWMVWRGDFPSALATKRPFGHLWRAACGTVAMATYFMALARLPLPDVTAIIYASPLITLVLATFLLGEHVGIYRWSAVGVGLCGIVLILWPHLGASVSPDGRAAMGAVLALATAFGMALVAIQLRHLTRSESTAAVVFYFLINASLLTLVTLPFGWVVPSPGQAVILVSIGLVGGLGQIVLTQAYRHAPASVLASFEYSSMIWALLLGYLLFGDVPQAIVFVGAAIVIAAGLYIIHRERRLGIADSRPPRSGPAP